MTLELVAEVPLSLLNLSRFQDAIVVHAECDDERTVKIFCVSLEDLMVDESEEAMKWFKPKYNVEENV